MWTDDVYSFYSLVLIKSIKIIILLVDMTENSVKFWIRNKTKNGQGWLNKQNYILSTKW